MAKKPELSPKTWQDLATLLKDRKPKKGKKKASGLSEKIDKLLNERKG